MYRPNRRLARNLSPILVVAVVTIVASCLNPTLDVVAKAVITVSQGPTSISSGAGLDLGSTTVSVPKDVVFTITNQGTRELLLTGSDKVKVEGSDSLHFTVVEQPSSPVRPRDNTTFTLRFQPSTTGLKTATLTIASNSAELSEFVYSITCGSFPADAPEIGLKQDATPISSSGAIDIGAAVVGSPKDVVFTIENTGTQPLNLMGSPDRVALSSSVDFQVTVQPPSSVGAGGSTTFTLQFDPGSSGAKSVGVTIDNNDTDEDPYTFTVNASATDAPAPEINVKTGTTDISSAGSINIGSAVVGSPVSFVFTIENIGSASLTLDGSPDRVALSSGVDFQVTVQPTSPVATSGSTTFTLQFDPSSAGAKSVGVTIDNNDTDEDPYTFTVNGTATAAPAPEIDIKIGTTSYESGQTIDFGSTALGTPVDINFTIENTGNADLELSPSPNYVALSSTTDFQVTSQPTSPVSAGGSTSFTVRFNPGTTGFKGVILTASNNDADEGTYQLTLNGTGQAPEINVKQATTSILSGGSYNYGDVISGEIEDVIFTIENTGPVPLNLTGIPLVAITGSDFSVISQPSTPVAASGSTTFTVRFAPSALGTRNGTATISNNDVDESSYVVNLTGTGMEFHGEKLVDDTPLRTGIASSVAASGNHVYMSYINHVNSSTRYLRIARSDDYGGTWTTAVLPGSSMVQPTTQSIPVLADGSNVFVVYLCYDNTANVAYSSDYGVSWQTRNLGGAQYDIDAAIDGTYLYVISVANWDLTLIQLPYNCGSQANYTIDAGTTQLSQPALAVDSSYAHVICAYGSAGTKNGVSYYRAPKTNLDSWSTAETVDTRGPELYMGWATALAANGDSVYAIYQAGTYLFRFARSTDAGANWTLTDLDSTLMYSYYGGADFFHADLVRDGTTLYLTFMTNTNELGFRKSTDGGVVWSAATYPSTAGFGPFNAVAVLGSKVFISGYQSSVGGLYFLKSLDGGGSW